MKTHGQPGAPPATSKLPELEGLRGIAALFVVFAHLQFAFFADDFARYLQVVATLGRPGILVVKDLSLAPFNGRFCVWVFWTLSGFALSHGFFVLRQTRSAAQSRAYLAEAALRRYPRLLLPVVGGTLFGYALCRFGWMHNGQLARVIAPADHPNPFLSGPFTLHPSLSGALTSAFWGTFFSLHLPPLYDPPLWTMKRELFGSFFLFAFLAVRGGRRGGWPLYVVVGAACMALHQTWANAFIAGIVLCDLRVNPYDDFRRRLELLLPWLNRLRVSRWFALLGTVLLVAAIGHFSQKVLAAVDADSGSDFAYILLSLTTIAWIQFSEPIRHLFSSRVAVFLGKISFGIYICHFPFIFSFSAWFYLLVVPYLGHGGTAWVTAILTIPAVIGLGTVFYYGSDKPSVPFSKWVASTLGGWVHPTKAKVSDGQRPPLH